VTNIKDEQFLKTFGERLRKHRLDRGFSQEQLANRANIPLSQVGRIERGIINPTLVTVNEISKALGMEIRDLFQ
jgi:transcriptional regulator with XRE-family HTH domain